MTYSSTAPGLSVSDAPTGGDYILFVHGWNMQPWAKDAFAATMLKRLYWQGYKGKFGAFQWPTTYTTSETFSDTQKVIIYDDGEYSAWLSAFPLEQLLSKFNITYRNKVFVLAHSMGNVVTGEALRIAGQAGQTLVNTYVATQAAVPGHCYDPTLSGSDLLDFNPVIGPIKTACGPSTPNIYDSWMMPSHSAVVSKVNFYNANDYALGYWNYDQVTKPDDRRPTGYEYSYNSPNIDTVKDLFKKQKLLSALLSLHLGTKSDVQDRYEIMAYASEPRSKALGELATASGFSSLNLQGVWPADPTTKDTLKKYGTIQWHSAEFYFTNADMMMYWHELLGRDGFRIN